MLFARRLLHKTVEHAMSTRHKGTLFFLMRKLLQSKILENLRILQKKNFIKLLQSKKGLQKAKKTKKTFREKGVTNHRPLRGLF